MFHSLSCLTLIFRVLLNYCLIIYTRALQTTRDLEGDLESILGAPSLGQSFRYAPQGLVSILTGVGAGLKPIPKEMALKSSP